MNNETKPTLKTQHVTRIRTSCSNYFFGAGKAAVTNPHSKKRQPSKLPTSLSELPENVQAKPKAKP